MTFEPQPTYAEYLASVRAEEARNKAAFTGEEPLEDVALLDRQARHVQAGGTVDDETMEKLRGRERQQAAKYYLPPYFNQARKDAEVARAMVRLDLEDRLAAAGCPEKHRTEVTVSWPWDIVRVRHGERDIKVTVDIVMDARLSPGAWIGDEVCQWARELSRREAEERLRATGAWPSPITLSEAGSTTKSIREMLGKFKSARDYAALEDKGKVLTAQALPDSWFYMGGGR